MFRGKRFWARLIGGYRHLANILRKLGLSSRSAAAAWGVRAGLV